MLFYERRITMIVKRTVYTCLVENLRHVIIINHGYTFETRQHMQIIMHYLSPNIICKRDSVVMILEELVGSLVSLGSSLIAQTPPLSRQCRQRYDWLIFEDSREDEESYEDLIHREYEEEETQEVPYYETIDIPVQNTGTRARPSICESFRRSVHVNIGLLLAVVLLGLITIGLVYLDLNTASSCIEWRHFNHSTPASVKMQHTIGDCIAMVPIFLWFPVIAAMLWGLKEFKRVQNYLSCLYVTFLIMAVSMVYRAILSDRYFTSIKYR